MKPRFTRRAAEDLSAIAAYVREHNPLAALRVRAAILESLSVLIDFPHVGRRQTIGGLRKLVTRRYRYLVYYSVDEGVEEIVIVTVQHPARAREHPED
jgi:toxin ParE1/3/4